MSTITRAFTTRRVKQSLMAAETSEGVQRGKGATGSIRHKISAPMELIHTTNMLSYNAPDIYPKTASSTGSSHKSDDELSDSAPTHVSSPPTSPDIESPKRSLSPEPKQSNHLSQYFTLPEQKSAPVSRTEAPVVPQRAASHTKKSYDSLVRQHSSSQLRQRSSSQLSEQSHRSVSTKASFTFSRSSSASTSTTVTSRSSSTPPSHKAKVSVPTVSSPTQSFSQPQLNHRKDFSQSQHPFGSELAQVSEIAEEFGLKDQLNDLEAEEQELARKGLCKFSADDYLGEIQGLFSSFFPDSKPMATAMWI
ncbi:hypothetical protein QBC47DRAFT_161875 [Echria macrotheca]|uniref:Uncharacterized protein n=1 Tax=Echria macrotheca TaxID=438768 RepID=A0AAJ0BG56_9PEZI|nr:hypothetical protein QBC47DRAFT_161875 [Echria macrotheca]